MLLIPSRRLDPPVDETRDHILGASDAPITLVEYGSYACPHCRAASETIASLRDRLGDRMRYVFRHRPLANNDLARRAAEMAECATREQFWKVHVELMARSPTLTEDDLAAVKAELYLDAPEVSERARARVDEDERTARANGVTLTPTFFINGRRYDGPWDEATLSDAMLGTLGHRVRATALDFASWGPSAGVLLLVATVLALVLSNSPVGDAFAEFWHRELGFVVDAWHFGMSLRHWVNDGLLTIFFSCRRSRDQARVHRRTPRKQSLGSTPNCGRCRWHDCSGTYVSAAKSSWSPGTWLGRPDGDRYGLRGRAHRDDGATGTTGIAGFPDGRRHRG
ncbi:putative DsbA family dithiol-disulfide isomerase [Ensifer mexicanus]|nr:putative DsbA family dithiol-disulfide isomerase [Sinorhizobium mexicanum]